MRLTKRLYRLLDRWTKGRFTEAWVLLLLPLFAVTFAIDFSLWAVWTGFNAQREAPETRNPFFDSRSAFYYHDD